ncbi:MAG: 50S ribosome-binding GTPase, partial [Bacteroidia bacterium]|nr:50S ribosome-binding GTPase [Bacteroidia bacterium]
MSGVVAIVGRPNVGKSTLFNRLIEERKAIVDDQSGVTRDRNYGIAEWNGRKFSVIDTGGYVAESEDVFESAIREQVLIAMDEADLVLFVVDAAEGLTLLDEQLAELMKKQRRQNVILVVNKVDNAKRELTSPEFYELGFENLFTIAAISGSGTGELLDAVVAGLPEDKPEIIEKDVPKIAIVGKPNVGKSSLVNAL